MHTLSELADIPPKGRHPCPHCGSSDGLSINDEWTAPESGVAVGGAKCFSCQEFWPGPAFLRDYHGYDYAEAQRDLGEEPASDDVRAVRRIKKKQLGPYPSRFSPAERARINALMTEMEGWLCSQHAAARKAAPTKSEALRHHERLERVMERALRREMDTIRYIDQIDSHYDE